MKSATVALILATACSTLSAADFGFVPVTDGRLYYEAVGSGEPVVLIHGNAGDRRHWDHQVPRLAKEFRVIRYDARGFGRSSCPQSESYAHHADLAALLDHLEVKTVHLVGWSMGCAIAIDFALTYPHRTKSLIAVGPWVSGYSSPAAKALFADMGKVQDAFSNEGQAAAVAAWMKAPFFAATVRDAAAAADFQRIASDYTLCAWGRPSQALNPQPVRRLEEIRVPTLVLTAEHDIPACLEIADLLNRSVIGSKKLVMAGTGHLLHMEKPTEFNESVAEFLRSTSSRDAVGASFDDISALRASLVGAIKAGDAAKYAALCTDDVKLLHANVPLITGRANLQEHNAEIFKAVKVLDLVLMPVEIVTAGDLTYEVGTQKLAIEPAMPGFKSVRKYVHVLKRGADGTWKFAVLMSNDSE